MNQVALLSASTSELPAAPRGRTIERAAREFEAVLLNTLLGSLEQSFSALPGKTNESGSDHFQYLGIQALSSSLAAGGGVGIARMILQHLTVPTEKNSHGVKEKSPTRGASLERPF
jgi:Rod binding domain-containing protein